MNAIRIQNFSSWRTPFRNDWLSPGEQRTIDLDDALDAAAFARYERRFAIVEEAADGGSLPDWWTITGEQDPPDPQFPPNADLAGPITIENPSGSTLPVLDVANADNEGGIKVEAGGDFELRGANNPLVASSDDDLFFGQGQTVAVTENGYLRIEKIDNENPPADAEFANRTFIPWYDARDAAPTVNLRAKNNGGFAIVVPSIRVGSAIVTTNTEPPDASINPGECWRWFDASNGAAKVKFKGKTLDGTVVSGQTALT